MDEPRYRTIKEMLEEEEALKNRMSPEEREEYERETEELAERHFGPRPEVRWKAVQELNHRPLNKLAQQALRQVKAGPEYTSPGELYILQLIQWALAKKKVTLGGPRRQQEILRAYLDDMVTWNPKKVMQVFEENDLGEPVRLLEPGPLDPVRLAEEAIEQLHSRLTAADRNYPVAAPLD